MCQAWVCLILIGLGAWLLVFSSAAVGKAQEDSLFSDATMSILRWRLLGPAHFSGRISDIAVPKGDPYTIYCAPASGGLWKTANNGTTWDPIFDNYGTGSMGAIAIADANPSVIWVGTGEPIAANHSTWGNGVYRSEDGGMTWAHRGLSDSQQIGRIVIDPVNPAIVYVAAVGHLWGKNRERGLFKTIDGGRTWIHSLAISDSVGVVDIALDPSDRNVLYAAAYGRLRGRYSRQETEEVRVIEGGGIFKSTDAGRTWAKLQNGLPPDRLGKIGLAVSPANPKKIYAVIERSPLQSQAKTAEFDTGGGVFCSADKGQTWSRVNKLPANRRPSYYSRIYAHPKEEDTVFVPIERMWKSMDGGRTFQQTDWAFSSWLTSDYIHGDFHSIWINPDHPAHIIVGTDGGAYSTYDGGHHWEAHRMPIGQFHAITVDMRKPYYIYGGMEDNGGWAGPSAVRHMSGITDCDWFKYETADGAYVQVDPEDNLTIFTEIQEGGIKRIDVRTGTWTSIRPRAEEGELPLRFNFYAPFLLSTHNNHKLYMGAQRLLKSANRGDDWGSISPDLTQGGGAATISSIAESPIKPGLLYVGTEDGNVFISRDDGVNWTNAAERIVHLLGGPDGRPTPCVSRVEASHFEEGTAYVSYDGHRDDDLSVYLFRTNDYGMSWISIKGNLPDGSPIRVIKEDPKNPELLFAGTYLGVYATINGGKEWFPLKNGLPPVPIADLVIHPRDSDLVVGTHGRGIYVMSIWPLQQLTSEVLGSIAHLFDIQPAILLQLDITKNKGASGSRRFTAQNPYAELFDKDAARYVLGQGSELAPPGAAIYYYLKTSFEAPVDISIFDLEGRLVRHLQGPARTGINRVLWDLRRSPEALELSPSGNDAVRLKARGRFERPGPLVMAGKYRVQLKTQGIAFEKEVIIEPDEFRAY